MEPDILILDEPAAGLDPKGRKDIFENIIKVYNERKITVVVVSHSMEDVAKFSKRIIVINKGKIFLDGTPEEVSCPNGAAALFAGAKLAHLSLMPAGRHERGRRARAMTRALDEFFGPCSVYGECVPACPAEVADRKSVV